MPGLTPRLPIERTPQDGYALIQTYADLITQNLKNIVLTSPGERMMDPVFGVGLRNYLFSQNVFEVHENLKVAISQQVGKYMPYVELQYIDVSNIDESNAVHVSIQYRVPSLGVADSIDVSTSLRDGTIIEM